ncbi:MAG: hypothetical protein JWM76_2004 [Pseudonocardiales bacterium]|nr:hypothetical protein [Pseudonocardiales bacterium]
MPATARVGDTGLVTSSAPVSPYPVRIAGPLLAGGATLVLLGALTWFTDSWGLQAIGLLALLIGSYLALVGFGLLRVRAEVRRRRIEDALDSAVLTTASAAESCDADGSCATCDTVCALRH